MGIYRRFKETQVSSKSWSWHPNNEDRGDTWTIPAKSPNWEKADFNVTITYVIAGTVATPWDRCAAAITVSFLCAIQAEVTTHCRAKVLTRQRQVQQESKSDSLVRR